MLGWNGMQSASPGGQPLTTFQALTTLMCIYTGLTNIKNPSSGVQWGSVVILILFNIINGISWIWLGTTSPAYIF